MAQTLIKNGSAESAPATKSFAEHLLDQGLLTQTEIEKAELQQKQSGGSLLQALRDLSLVEPHALAEATSSFFGVPVVTSDDWKEAADCHYPISRAFLRSKTVVPLAARAEGVLLAMEEPSDGSIINAVRIALERPIIPRVAAAEDIYAAIERLARDSNETSAWSDATSHDETNDDVEHLRDMALGTPVVRFVNQMMQEAVHSRATDIHIEPFEGRLSIRMRVDGMLREVAPPPPSNMSKAIVSRIKILAGLNIAERRLPQDGRSRVRMDHHRLDLRVATMPTIYGEAVVIRLLDNVRRVLNFSKLGFSKRDEEVIRKHLSAPYGLILVTGPTGSGKTTTLATALSLMNQDHRKILTIEDPIEYEIDGVNQTQAKPEIGLSFAHALRSFLRHDPDVLMVGEMRDSETASIGIHAALTGHLVLTTLHTNTAAGAIPRLLDMGIDAFLLASSLRCVIGQRLVRVLCAHCKEATEEQDEVAPDLRAPGRDRQQVGEVKRAWKAKGCSRCNGTGYSDRIVIAEVLDVNDKVRELIQPGGRPADIEAAACRTGMITMVSDGLRKCQEGTTTAEEVRRVALDF